MSTGPKFSWGACTHVGRVRERNEDSMLARPWVFAVADGMGGHARGDAASQAVVAVLAEPAGRLDVTAAELHAVLQGADAAVRDLADGGPRPPGSTVTGAVVTYDPGPPYWMVFNVGDSRTHLLRDGTLEQVTVDHSEVQDLLDAGRISADEAMGHPAANVVTRALGLSGGVRADLWMIPALAGDRLLLCSDGVTKELRPAELLELLRAYPALPDGPHAGAVPGDQDAADAVVRAAVERAGTDNATAVVVTCWEGAGPQRAGRGVGGAAGMGGDDRTVPVPHTAASEGGTRTDDGDEEGS